jgi:hypothetical protein
MKERPIIFSGEMVRVILDGRKTHTRRIVKALTPAQRKMLDEAEAEGEAWPSMFTFRCPYGVAGDRLWVKEAWFPNSEAFDSHDITDILYRADWSGAVDQVSWRPSIHMPRWASRITLEITKVRVERLQDITPADAEAEGIARMLPSGLRRYDENMVYEYEKLWDSLHGKGAWEQNPWVWVLKFKKIGGA